MNRKTGKGYRVIVVDDDREMRESLTHLLGKAGWRVESLGRAEEAEERQSDFQADVILSDVRMPGMSGLDLLVSLKAMPHTPPIVLISAHGDIPMAVEAMQKGAYSFIEKPYDPRRLLTVLHNAAERHRLELDAWRLKARLANLSGLDRVLLGKADSIKVLREDIVNLVDSDASIMLLGETGTGKELVARALHDLSARMSAPFIAINCATLAPATFEQSMFGKKGEQRGVLAQADTGTLFLDEFGACPMDVQAKLLRVIESKEFMPVGSDQPERVDIRILSASNEHMDLALGEGRFREDLYYRLNTVILTLPPLRDRRGDIPLLFAHFMGQYAGLYEVTPPETTTEDLAALMGHDWPGNVRELSNVAERRILMARRGRGSVQQALAIDHDFSDVPETLREAVAAFEGQLISKAIKAHQGRMDAIAEALGIGRRTLNEKIVKLGLNKKDLL